MEQSRVPFYASNLSVGLSISMAGFGMQMATGGWHGAAWRVGNKAKEGWTRDLLVRTWRPAAAATLS